MNSIHGASVCNGSTWWDLPPSRYGARPAPSACCTMKSIITRTAGVGFDGLRVHERERTTWPAELRHDFAECAALHLLFDQKVEHLHQA
jgi:hypothetical protein